VSISNNSSTGPAPHLHRMLDEVFAGVEMSTERQDLKEEIRANLIARVAELEASGADPDVSARRAIDELGDLRSALDLTGPAPDAKAPDWAQQQVRPRPAYLLRTIVLATVAAAALAVLVLAATVASIAVGVQLIAVLVLALAAGAGTADALCQETTSNHPMPVGRAVGYGAGTALVLTALGAAWLWLRGDDLPWLIAAGILALAGIALLAYLGATQTNRHKAWVLRVQASHAEVGDRFTTDPTAAARFGIYTMVIWLVALAAFVALTLTVGWAWSWLALVGGLAAMMLMLARMQFRPQP
jgi:hypothetical protein